MPRSAELAPSDATTRVAATTPPSFSVSSAFAGPAANPVISTGARTVIRSFSASISAAVIARFGTMCAKGSPGLASPSNCRNSGRAISPVPESVILIARTGSASPANLSQSSSASKARLAETERAEALASCGTETGRRSRRATRMPGANRASVRASARPTGPAPTIAMSNSLVIAPTSALPRRRSSRT